MGRKIALTFKQGIESLIIHEDQDLLLVNKPPGMITASGPRDTRPTLWRAIQARGIARREFMGIIHRLDREASGLLVFSKNDRAYQALKKQFFKHTVDRIYQAIVQGVPRQAHGRIENRLVEWQDGSVHVTRQANKGELAISDYQVLRSLGKAALVQVILQTGRKHQIRVHLAGLGHPILGDRLYNPVENQPGELMLVAKRLSFDHPRGGRRVNFEVEPPSHMRAFIQDSTASLG